MYYEINLPAWKLAEWSELTESNAHGKRLERIADYCATFAEGEARQDLQDLAALFNTINARHDKSGRGISRILYETRSKLSAELRELILELFGPEVLADIHATG